jgi:hypothetical protein
MKEIAISILTNDIILGVLVTALVSATGWLTHKIGAWLGAKTEGASYANLLAKVGVAIETAVLCVEQTLVPLAIKAKAPNSPGGTSITSDEANQLFAAADNAVVAMLGGDAGIEALCKSVRMDRMAFDAMRRNMIEAAVHKLTK